MKLNIKFNRYELSGAFGDIGTDFPLLVGMITVAQLDVASVFIMYGLMQLATGFLYGIPMPVQPLKAMAALVIAQKATGDQLFAAGLVIGCIMLILSVSGWINWIAKMIPKSVVRGIQLGLGIQLASLALKDFVGAEGLNGYILAGLCFIIALICLKKKFPGALLIIFMGVVFALLHGAGQNLSLGFSLPQWRVPASEDLWVGFLTLALTQLPLSLGNSILATRQTVEDLFPEKKLTPKKISLTYACMNLINPFFGGVPVCHGSGGLAGHYAFGARTGGSVVIYGIFFLILGAFFANAFSSIITLFPKPALGVILFVEGIVLMRFIKDLADSPQQLFIAFTVGLMAVNLPLGYLWGLLAGVLMHSYFTFSVKTKSEI